MQAVVVAELGVKGDRQQGALAGGDRLAVDGGEDLDAGAVLGDPRRADEDRAHGAALHVGEPQVLLEGVQLAPERVALGDDVHEPQVVAVEQDEPRAGAEDRLAGGVERAQRLDQALALDAEGHGRRLAAGHDEPVEAFEVARRANLAHLGAQRAQDAGVRGEAALQGEDADERRRCHQPRPASN